MHAGRILRKVRRYIELAKEWGTGRGGENRMIKVPATAAGIDALEAIFLGIR